MPINLHEAIREINPPLGEAYENDEPFTMDVADYPRFWTPDTVTLSGDRLFARRFKMFNRAPYIDDEVDVVGFVGRVLRKGGAFMPYAVVDYSEDLPLYLFRVQEMATIERAVDFARRYQESPR